MRQACGYIGIRDYNRDVTPPLQKLMENNMEHEIQTGLILITTVVMRKSNWNKNTTDTVAALRAHDICT